MTTKVLTRRQTRWVEILAEYDFVLTHMPGKKNPIDGLSCHPDYAEDIEPLEGYIVSRNAFCDNIVRVHAVIVQPTSDLHERILEVLKNDTVALQHRKDIFEPSLKTSKSF